MSEEQEKRSPPVSMKLDDEWIVVVTVTSGDVKFRNYWNQKWSRNAAEALRFHTEDMADDYIRWNPQLNTAPLDNPSA